MVRANWMLWGGSASVNVGDCRVTVAKMRTIPKTSEPLYSDPTARRGSLDVATTFVAVLTVWKVGAVLTVLRSVITPFLTGLLLLFLISPEVSLLDVRHVPRWLTYLLLSVIDAAGVIGMEQLIETYGER